MENISKRSLIMSRTFDAPVDLVWKVLTTPQYLKDWWGPEGFTNTIRKMEVVEGGKWEFTMHGPDGTNYENEYIYTEVKPLQKIVLNHLKKPKFTIIVSLINKGDKTKITWENIFDSVPSLEEAVRAFKADVGLKQNLERLSLFLKQNIS